MEPTEYIPEPTDGRVRVNRGLKMRAEELGISPTRICNLALKEAIRKMEAADKQEVVPGSSIADK